MAVEAVERSVTDLGRRAGSTLDEIRRRVDTVDPERLARALGWLSIGLGLAEIVTPRLVETLTGIRDRRGALRLAGARELATGIGILSRPRDARWLWARVAGDAMDLALLGEALPRSNGTTGRVVAATAAVVGVTAIDALSADRVGRDAKPGDEIAASAGATVTINRSAAELYRFWRDLRQLPRFMKHVVSVEPIGDRRSHWVAAAPAGTRIEWDAEIVEDRPNERIGWRSVGVAAVHHAGSVRFEPAPGGRGTKVTVELRYHPPGGAVGAFVAKLLGRDPAQQAQEDLRRFKQLVETGEIATNAMRADAKEAAR